jgi:hypothetical protein
LKDFSSWPQRAISVTTLQLDPQNPRIPPTDRELTQPELIAELVEHDDVYGLAKEIVEQGYWPLESLIAVKEGSKSIVVEGNRRLAALKVLINPTLAPEPYLLA